MFEKLKKKLWLFKTVYFPYYLKFWRRNYNCYYKQEPIHYYFGLTYASYLVLPRSILKQMDKKWQKKFVKLLEDFERVCEKNNITLPMSNDTKKDISYFVKTKEIDYDVEDCHTGTGEGREVSDLLCDYRYPKVWLKESK